jgi:hypothetical protein
VTIAGRRVPLLIEAIRAKTARRSALALFAALALTATFAGDWPAQMTNFQPAWLDDNLPLDVARWLERRGLKQGIGEYWSANLITALSEEVVQIRSVGPLRGRLVPYVWVNNRLTYNRYPQFAVWVEPNQSHITIAEVRATHTVCALAAIRSYRIAVFQDATNPSRCSGAPG